jgi:hypothetical protein
MLKCGGPVPIAPQIRHVILCKFYTKTRPVSHKVVNHDEQEIGCVNSEQKSIPSVNSSHITTDPVRPGDFSDAAKKFGRTKDVERVFSIKRGTLYNAEKLGLVRGVLLRLRGQKSGVKLWDMRSIEQCIRREMERQR